MAGNIIWKWEFDWNQSSIIEEFRQEAEKIHKEAAGLEERLFYQGWKAVCMLERESERGGVLSLEEFLPEIHREYPFFEKYIHEALLLMMEGCAPDYILEVMFNHYYIEEKRQEELPVFYLALQCIFDLWEYAVGKDQGKTVDQILIKTMAVLPKEAWAECIEIARAGDLKNLSELKAEFEQKQQEECSHREDDHVYEWLERTRKDLFPKIMTEGRESRKRWKYIGKRLFNMGDIARRWGLFSLVHEAAELAGSQDKGLAFLGGSCCDEAALLDGNYIDKMIQEYEAAERNVAEDMEKYMCIRGLWMITNEVTCRREFQAVMESMIPGEGFKMTFIKSYEIYGMKVQRIETEWFSA